MSCDIRAAETYAEGLHVALKACAEVLFERSYVEFLRLAFAEGERDILRLALETGHGGVKGLLRSFLAEGVERRLTAPVDCDLEAELLLAQVQGLALIDALLRGREADEEELAHRVERAAADFCRRNLLGPARAG